MVKKASTKTARQLRLENEALRARLAEAEDTLNAIRHGAVDAIVISAPDGDKIFSLTSAETPYRLILEEMNEGAATLAADGTILYCNRRVAELFALPLEQITGSFLTRLVAEADQPKCAAWLQAGRRGRFRAETSYTVKGRPPRQLQFAFSPLPPAVPGEVCLMIADISELKQKEAELRLARDTLEQQVIQRTAALTQTNQDLAAARLAAVKMMEDAVAAKNTLALTNQTLLAEITERKRVEEALRTHQIELETMNDELRAAQEQINASRQKYLELYDFAPMGYCTLDPNGRIKEANLTAVTLFGVERAYLLGTRLDQVIKQEDRDIFFLHRRQLSTTTTRQTCELRLVKPDGAEFWAQLDTIIFQDQQAQAAQYRTTITDITARKRAEEEAHKSHEQLLKFASQVPGMLYQFERRPDGSFRLPFTTEAIRDIFGCSPEEVLEDFSPISRVIHPDDLTRMNAHIEESFKHLTPFQFEYRVVRHDQSVHWILAQSIPEKLPNGSVIWSGFNRDITEHKQKEEEIRNLAKFPAENPSPVLRVKGDGILIYANPASDVVLTQWNCQPGQMIPKRWRALVKATMTSGVSQVMETRLGDREFMLTLSPVVEENYANVYGLDITARKQAEEALRRSEQLFRLSLKNAPVTVAAQDSKLRFLWAYNQRTVDPLAVIGKTDTDIFIPEDAERLSALKRQVLASGEEQHEELWLTRNGQPMCLDLFLEPLRDEAGNIIGIGSATVDLTPIKLAKEALQQSEVRLSALLENADGSIWSVDRAYRLIVGNTFFRNNFRAVLGREPQPGDCVLVETLAQAVLTEWRGYYDRALSGEVFSVETFTRYLQEPRVVEYRFRPIRTPEGAITGVTVAGRDITDRKRAEESLRESEERLQLVLEGGQLGYWDWNIETGEVRRNVRWAEILGYTLPEIEFTVKQWTDLHHPDDRATAEKSIQDHLAGLTPIHKIEYRMRAKNGQYKWILDCARIVKRDAQGRPLRMSGTHTDITDRKQAEAELRAAKDAAEAANRAKSQFLARMSHELRTPLNAILGYAQLFLQDASLTEPQRDAIQIMHRSGEHLLLLITDVLDFAKIDAGKLELRLAEFDLPGCLHTLVAMMRIRAEEKGLALTTDFAADLPQMISGDQQRLRQILLNLLSNAIKFTENGGVTFRATVHCHRLSDVPIPSQEGSRGVGSSQEGSRGVGSSQEGTSSAEALTTNIRFEVEDTGVGIVPEDLEKIFRPFQQVGEKRYYSDGVGLGLPISQKFAQMMGSDLHVTSTPGQGSCFWFDLTVPESAQRDFEGAPAVMATVVTAPTPAQPAEPILPPPPAELAILYDAIRIGDILAIQQRLQALEALDPAYLPFVAALRPLAKNLRITKIQTFLEQFMVTTQSV